MDVLDILPVFPIYKALYKLVNFLYLFNEVAYISWTVSL